MRKERSSCAYCREQISSIVECAPLRDLVGLSVVSSKIRKSNMEKLKEQDSKLKYADLEKEELNKKNQILQKKLRNSEQLEDQSVQDLVKSSIDSFHLISNDHEFPKQFQQPNDGFAQRTTDHLHSIFRKIQHKKKEKQTGEVQTSLIDLMSVAISSLDHQRKMIEQGVTLAEEGSDLTKNIADTMSSALGLFFSYIETLQTRQDTSATNESTLRQVDRLLSENLPNMNIDDLEECDDDLDLLDFSALELPTAQKSHSLTFQKLQSLPLHKRTSFGSCHEIEEMPEELAMSKKNSLQRKNSMEVDETSPPVKEEQLEANNFDFVYGWFVTKDPKFTHFYDIDYMIELGRACQDFSKFKLLLKDQQVKKETNFITLKFKIEKNKLL